MPYAMFFSGGQAVHYSPDFAARGYNGCSHGCVNIRNRGGIRWVFNRIRVGDRVIVYRSLPPVGFPCKPGKLRSPHGKLSLYPGSFAGKATVSCVRYAASTTLSGR